MPLKPKSEEQADISVLIPVLNDQAGLNRTINSIKEDDLIPLNIVVVDDGSPVPIKTPKHTGIHTIKLLRLDENGGVAKALNYGLQYILQKKYKYVARIDAGDLTIKGRFKRQYDFLQSNTRCGVVGTGIHMVDENERLIRTIIFPENHDDIQKKLNYTNVIAHPSVMIRCDVFRELGFYSTSFKHTEDYEFWRRVAKSRKFTLANIPEPLTVYVRSSNSIGRKYYKYQLWSSFRVLLKYFNLQNLYSYLGLLSWGKSAFITIYYHLGLNIKKAVEWFSENCKFLR